MTILRSSIDRTDFIGRYLAEVGFGVGTISLRLASSGQPGASSMAVIVISGQLSVTINGSNCIGDAPAPELAVVISKLLNESITEVNVDEMSCVCIVFGADRCMKICPDPNGFESATISIPGKDVLVV